MAGAKADVKYGFWVAIGVLVAVGAWGLISMLLHSGFGRSAG